MSRSRNVLPLLVGLVTGIAVLSQDNLIRDRAFASEPIVAGSANKNGAAGTGDDTNEGSRYDPALIGRGDQDQTFIYEFCRLRMTNGVQTGRAYRSRRRVSS